MSINTSIIPQTDELQVNDWYKNLLEDLQDLEYKGIVLTKLAFGQRLLQDELKFNKPEYGDKRIENIAKDLEHELSDVKRCVQFARKVLQKADDVRQFEGQSWNFIIRHYFKTSGLPNSEKSTIPNGDGTGFFAYSIDELRESGCLVDGTL